MLLLKISERQEGSSLHEMTLRALCLLLQNKPEQTTQRLKDNQIDARDILQQLLNQISTQNDREAYRVGYLNNETAVSIALMELLRILTFKLLL